MTKRYKKSKKEERKQMIIFWSSQYTVFSHVFHADSRSFSLLLIFSVL